MDELKKELEHWQEQCRKADNEKTELLLRKLDADDFKKKALEEVTKLMSKDEEKDSENHRQKECWQREKDELNRKNAELKREIQKLGDKLEKEYSDYAEISQELKFEKELPEKRVKFTKLENVEEEDIESDMFSKMDCQFLVAAKIPFRLQGGEALLTFEEEEVAQNILKQRHLLNMDHNRVEVKADPVALNAGLKFEVNVKISKKKIIVSHLPDDIPEESMRDKLELNFYKSRLGGGEVEDVKYDKQSRTAVITFLEAGAADRVAKRKVYPFVPNTSCSEVFVTPYIERSLHKLQTYSGISRRTILLREIPAAKEDEENIQDMIEIHFQKPSNGGGEVESIKYLSKGSKQCLRKK
ncbi:N-myc-interactor isoform X2 [Rhinatrema bivittatum]|uniref:N-myc-interactor isoform X2 n=1 Tax=Rhinatrema bivittatum TaxID=194408 RepID=UPI00112AAC8E|nr:N-myc-interactor isoform X2 [Rhinatrema bivittatum]